MRSSAVSLLLMIAALPFAADSRAEIEWTFEPSYLIPEWPDRASIGFAFDYNSGKFESDERSNTLSLQPTVRFQSDNVVLRASLPFYQLDGRLEAELDATRESKWGVGDLTLDLGYTLYPIVRGGPFLDFLTRVKVPTADALFGTDEVDVTLLGSVFQPLADDFAAIGDFGVRLRGGAEYRDTLQAALIVGRQTTDGVGIWLAYDWRESPASFREDEHELTPFLSVPFGTKLRVEPYALMGLSDGSPDWGIGTSVWWRF